MGRPDWNFETVKFPRSHKEKFRYQPPPVVSDSKWMRNRPVSREPSKTADENKSFESLRHSSRGSVSWEDSDIDPESSRMSVTARAKEYWVNNVRTPERHKKSTHRHQQRPGTSMSTLGSDSMAFDSEDEIGTSRRPETSEGFATRFRYNVQGVRGGTFGNGARKDDVDWKIYDAKTKPGVGQYNVVREDSTPINGGKMLDTFDAVGSANWEARRKSRLPAPGQYDRDVNLPVTAIGGRFAEGNRWQETEVFEQRSRELPGPVEYDAGYSRDKAYKRVNGGLISDAKVMSELDWTLLRGSRTPGLPFPCAGNLWRYCLSFALNVRSLPVFMCCTSLLASKY